MKKIIETFKNLGTMEQYAVIMALLLFLSIPLTVYLFSVFASVIK